MRIRTLSLVCVILVTFLIVHPANIVQSNDGNWLVKYMKEYEKFSNGDENSERFGAGVYSGYVLAIGHGLFIEYQYKNELEPRKLFAIVAEYLKDHPERWNEPAYFLVRDVFEEKFFLRNQ